MAGLLEEKTSGNPFFIKQLLRSFYNDGLIHYTFDDMAPVPNDEDEAAGRGQRAAGGGKWAGDPEELPGGGRKRGGAGTRVEGRGGAGRDRSVIRKKNTKN